jgi:hypothetical protein
MSHTEFAEKTRGLLDNEGRPFHRIVCRSKFAGCPGWHATAAFVKLCSGFGQVEGARACTWRVPAMTEDGPSAHDCGYPATEDKETGGYSCVKGHDFLPASYMAEHGLAYAEDEAEAAQLYRAGVQPLEMSSGRVWAG